MNDSTENNEWSSSRFYEVMNNINKALYSTYNEPHIGPINFGDSEQHMLKFNRIIPGSDYRVGELLSSRWRVLDLIGIGGMGVVYEVMKFIPKKDDTVENRFAAIKGIKKELVLLKSARDAIRKEVEMWIRLEPHPNIINATWFEEINSQLFIEMESMGNPRMGDITSIQHYLNRNGYADEKTAVTWIIQACDGLMHAISCGLACHSDLKPANLLLGKDGIIKVSDFGLSKGLCRASVNTNTFNTHEEEPTVTSIGMSESLAGSRPYMAPERFKGEGFDERGDVYSLGIVFHELIKGTLPFDIKTDLPKSAKEEHKNWNVWKKAHKRKPKIEVGGRLGEIIKACLERKPRNRLTSISELRSELEAVFFDKFGAFVLKSEEDTDRSRTYVIRGTKHLALKEYTNAVELFDKAIDLDSKNIEAWIGKAECQFEIKDKKANDSMRQALSINEDDYRILNLIAKVAIYNRWDNKWSYIDKALEANAYHADIFFWIAESYFYACKDYKNALQWYEFSILDDPKYARPWLGRGNCLLQQNELDESLECFERAIERDCFLIEAWTQKIEVLFSLNLVDRAWEQHLEAMEIFGDDPWLMFLRGRYFLIKEKYEQAMITFNFACNKSENDPRLLTRIGAILAQSPLAPHASDYLDKALKLDSTNMEILEIKGYVHLRCEQWKEAYECFQAVGDPTGEPFLKDSHFYHMAISAAKLNRFEDALEAIEKAISLNDSDGQYWTVKKYVLNELGREDEAKEAGVRAETLNKD